MGSELKMKQRDLEEQIKQYVDTYNLMCGACDIDLETCVMCEDKESRIDVIVTGCDMGGDVVLPDFITVLGSYCFYNNKNLRSLVLPSSVRHIGNGAFHGCSGLISVNIPESVKSIGKEIFKGCARLPCIEIPNSVKLIEKSSFEITS